MISLRYRDVRLLASHCRVIPSEEFYRSEELLSTPIRVYGWRTSNYLHETAYRHDLSAIAMHNTKRIAGLDFLQKAENGRIVWNQALDRELNERDRCAMTS